ncbi:MAG: ABC transporter permease [Bryobacterales bacterium]|nr:ABC transporter permease [Bryobacterales bacterium]
MPLYRALLYLYPASFRAEYGEEMCAIFARERRPAGFFGVVRWIRTFFEIGFNAAAAHADILRQDLRYILRTLRQSPGFTFTAIIVAALGIGATTAAYTMVDYVLIRPFPFADQDRLVKLLEDHASLGAHWDLSPANYRDWKGASTSFQTMGAYRSILVNVVAGDTPERIDGASLTSEILPMLGVQPILGRMFSVEDDLGGAPETLILSYSLWRELFAGDASVLGRKVLIDGVPHTIIGVMPQGFYFPNREARMWTAMRFAPPDFLDRTNCYITALGRLKRDTRFEQAVAEMQTVTGRLAQLYPKELAHTGATITRLREDVSPQSRMMLNALLGAAACVLLIACANLANLLLARSAARRKELAVRAAMGAGRERLVRQMLTESILLAAAGGILGVFLAIAALPALVRLVPVSLPLAEIPSVNWNILLFAVVLTIATGIGFGVVPAVRTGGASAEALRDNARSGGGRRERVRSTLVVVEVAASMVLLVSSALLIRALWRIQATDPGFRPDHTITLRTSLPMPKYDRTADRVRFYRHVLDGARKLPGVTNAAYTSFLPMVMRGGLWPIKIPEHPEDPANQEYASLRYITPGYFAAMGIPLRSGRDVAESDTRDGPFIAVISESFARHYWPGQDPIGRHFNVAFFDRVVVGIAGDVRVRGLERTSEPQVYVSYQQVPDGWMPWYPPKDLVVRAAGDAAALVPALRRIIGETDPEEPVSDVQTLDDIVAAETGTRTVQLIVLGSFAGIALLLAAIGVHGLLSFAVSARMQEIGVRIALGATRGSVLGMILGQATALAAAGIVIGAVLAFAAGRTLEALLAGVKPGDLSALLSASVTVLIMAAIGSLLPALRATRVEPIDAIRTQ